MEQMPFVRALRTGLLLFASCISIPAWGDDIYCSIEGAIQGKITGELTQKGLEGKMVALKLITGVNSPYDPGGRKSGARLHQAVALSRESGRGSPQLMHALVTNEMLKEVRCDFYAPRIISGATTMAPYQSIKLTNAFLVGFHRKTEPATDLSRGALRSVEDLTFVFQKIDLMDLERNVSASDLWAPP